MKFPPINEPAPITDEQIAAVKAVANGNASAGQQKAALLWIMDEACGAWRDAMCPGRPDMTGYFNGRRSVALQISAVLRSRPKSKDKA